jgi:hypothetical protein
MDDDSEFYIEEEFDGHSIHDDNPSLDIIGVLCVCICGRKFIACIGCLINGNISACPECDIRMPKAHLN